MGKLPEWNLPKLSKSDVTVGDQPLSSESFKGSRENLLNGESPKSAHDNGYENLGGTFREPAKKEEV